MLSVEEIKSKVKRWWDDGSFLQSSLKGLPFGKREVPKIGLDNVRNIHENAEAVFKSQDELIKNSKEVKGYGYTIEWQERNYKNIGNNKFVKKITIDTEQDFLRLINKETEFKRFKERVKYLVDKLPELNSWIEQNPLLVIDNDEKWEDLMKVLMYFKDEHVPHKYYVRELPISVHTKFIENNIGILRSLLDYLIPNKITSGKYFNERYSIKDKEKLIRVRILCDRLMKGFNYSDFSIRLSDFISNEIPAENIVIAENELNFLTLPKKESTIAIWSGGGFQVSYLANVTWLKARKIFYWGDIDAAGLAILSQIRTYYPSVKSILMDRVTFERYYDNGKTDKLISAKQLRGLTPEEIEFFSYLNENKLRLEQEKIPQSEIIELFKKNI